MVSGNCLIQYIYTCPKVVPNNVFKPELKVILLSKKKQVDGARNGSIGLRNE
jgi:hypothetical protein